MTEKETTTQDYMIAVKGLTKKFGTKTVLENADISVERGSICGLIGINGAGKSTLLRLIATVLRPDRGEILIDGKAAFESEDVKRNIFFLPDEPYYDAGVTGEKLKALYSAFYPFDDEIFRAYTGKFSLDTTKPIRNFSKGMKRQLFISVALACKPKLLLLDEAFDGLDPLARLEFKRGLISLQEDGCTVVIASHSLRELEDICDSYILIDNTGVACGKIDTALGQMMKLQLAFEGDIEEEDLPLKCLHYEKTGRVITVVTRGDREKIMAKLAAMKPLILEEIPMDFEDMFIEEVKSRGYLQ